jgi:hypothetical protein
MDLWIDEAESVIPQMLAGGTLKGKRQAVALQVLKKAVSQCNNVYLLDAFLTDKTVDFVASLEPSKAVTKYGNIYQPERPQPITIIDVVDLELIVKFSHKVWTSFIKPLAKLGLFWILAAMNKHG